MSIEGCCFSQISPWNPMPPVSKCIKLFNRLYHQDSRILILESYYQLIIYIRNTGISIATVYFQTCYIPDLYVLLGDNWIIRQRQLFSYFDCAKWIIHLNPAIIKFRSIICIPTGIKDMIEISRTFISLTVERLCSTGYFCAHKLCRKLVYNNHIDISGITCCSVCPFVGNDWKGYYMELLI